MTPGRHGRRYYLSDVPLEEARARFRSALNAVGALAFAPAETVPLEEAIGRTTAGPVVAKVSSPHYDSAAMDGVAVRAVDTVGAAETSPVRLHVGEQAQWVDTGEPLPAGFDSVIMVEVVHEVDESTIEIQAPVAPYQHVRPLGEDMVATELVLPENHRLRPVDLAACAAAGLGEVAVRRKPRVTVIPTGTELVPPGAEPLPGQIIDSNTLMLAAMIDEWGAEARRRRPVPDDYDKLRSAITGAIRDSDVVVVNAGSSAGSEDYTAQLVEELGELLVHGTAIRPGHPVVLGHVDRTPVLGIPGYPVSAAITCEIFVKPLIESMLGVAAPPRPEATATITRKVASPMGEDEFLRVGLGRVGGRLVATPIQRGAGVITSLVRADALVVVPRFSEGLSPGDQVRAELLRPLEDIERTIVAIGSHDLTLDLLSSGLRRRHPDVWLSSTNVGSLGGLLSLSRGEAHLAGCHLLDEETGEYNVSFVRRYLKGHRIVLVNLVNRLQGLIVARGNPRGIDSLGDLARDDITFINRQRGSGTRMLLDYRLKQMGISPEVIRGYEREDYTHLSVAAAVASGRVDVGLGILSAARAMGLDFVPLLQEQYDLVIPREVYESDRLRPLLSLVRDADFHREVQALGGYDTASTGQVVAEID